MHVPEIHADHRLHDLLAKTCSGEAGIDRIEAMIATGESLPFGFLEDPSWLSFRSKLRETLAPADYVVVRGLPVSPDGVSLVLAALAISTDFRSYRSSQVVKKFRMSPWAKGLSHTTREGDFHTDLNTDGTPPEVTAIQCLEPDPGAPRFGANRVARLQDLLIYLEKHGKTIAIDFLQSAQVSMINGRHQRWTGTIVAGESIRYHPATLRTARQGPSVADDLEHLIGEIHEAALAVSAPFHLEPGDLFFVSNIRALHYRGECSVVFDRYPTDYRARSIFVLHLMSGP